ncbi:hypothetical protein QQS21_004652 [Conoideocrella luteorostrata]|uniref:Laccase n=1 Tax=Conoideocrella luteorostrata TaxID=1105319 RepID=A0AAJ0FUG4_9HYPO|nr:hypothetical protein QQS21_004652 [Conoideocrella luteorostrata]
MAKPLQNAGNTHRQPNQVLRCGVLLAITVICFALYFVVVVRYFSLRSSQNGLPPAALTAYGNNNQFHNSLNSINDAFVLHPEQHIFRATKTIRLYWNITREARRPDGVLKEVYLINGWSPPAVVYHSSAKLVVGLFPGPTIEARSGDDVEITVANGIANDTDDGLAIHWHGMIMKGFNDMDGVVGVTQCSVASGQTLTYKFQIHREQHGTFWYHAHSAVKRADGLYGGLVVHRPVGDKAGQSDLSIYEYDSEKMLLVGDWYHRSADQVLAEYKDFRNFAYEPVPDSLLINGIGCYNCSNARPGKPVDCLETDVPSIQVSGNKAVRLRVVNTGASAGYSFQLENAALQLITVDGGGFVSNATPQTSTVGVVYPGERVDMLLLPDMTAKNENRPADMTMGIILDPGLMPLMNLALTRKQVFPLRWTPSAETMYVRKDRRERVNIYDIQNTQGSVVPRTSGLHQQPVETALLYTSLGINAFKNDEPWGELNHTSWVWKNPTAKPLLATDRNTWGNGTEQANPLRTFNVPWFEAGERRWLDLVVNNIDDKGHPFHLHGYEFYVLSSRQREFGRPYNPFEESNADVTQNIDTKTPLKKDTVYIKPQGYVILRFPLHNPGLWLMHCHVLWHQAVGMGVVLQVGNITKATARRVQQSCRQ